MTIPSYSDLDSYVAAVRAMPMLPAEEEGKLTRRWRDHADMKAADRLIGSHLRLVVRVAYALRGYGVPLSDLIAEGNLGLVQALRRFDPERDLRFSTYAIWWVRAAMYEYVMAQSTPVRIALTAERKKIFFKLRSLKARLRPGSIHLTDADAREIARILEVREDSVQEMDRLLEAHDRSLDAPRPDSDEPWGTTLADDRPDPETMVGDREETDKRRRVLAGAWETLSERERVILADRRLRETPLRLEDLAQRFNISRERVRQIENSAANKLKKLVAGAAPQLASA